MGNSVSICLNISCLIGGKTREGKAVISKEITLIGECLVMFVV